MEIVAPDPRPDGRRARPRPPRRRPPGPRPPLLASTRRSSAGSAGAAASFDAGGLEETVAWYRENRDWWEPIKSGEYRGYYEQQYAHAPRRGGRRERRVARRGLTCA